MRAQIVQVFGFARVYVARDVQVEVVGLDLCETNGARVVWQLHLSVEHVHDLMQVLAAETVLGTVLHKAAARVDHEDAASSVSVLFIYNHDAGWDAHTIEQVRRQAR